MQTEILRAKIETPLSQNDPKALKAETIPLPPQELWGDLDNAGARQDEKTTGPAPAMPSSEPAPLAVYLGKVRETTVPLAFPFEYQGVEYKAIRIRRLTLGEVQDLLQRTSGRPLTTMDIYAEMTGLPVEILRALDDEDGLLVTDTAYDFLPPRFRADLASPAT